MSPLRSLRLRLVAVLTGVVACAMGVVFLYVVPSLRQNLISDRLTRLVAVAQSERQAPGIKSAFGNNTHIPRTLQRASRIVNGQASAYVRSNGRLVPVPGVTPPVLSAGNRIVRTAERGGIGRGRTPGGGVVVAFPVANGGVVLLSQGVADVDTAAALVERRILIATGLALAVATIVGWVLAVAVSRRVGKLESASSRIAAGQFDQPIGDDSPDELGRLARSFDLMQDRLAQVDRARKDFIANASHELRTPLFSLGGFLELLAEEDLDAATREEFVLTMREQVTRLTKLATDLLDLSRLDSGAVEVGAEPVDLAAAARGLVREFRGIAARHGSRVVLTRPASDLPHGIGDEQRVQQIGRVLVDNAVRHNPDGTEVRVEVGADDGHVTLTVSDDGPGIDADSQRHLFERFWRGPQSSASGSGLGLAIAGELAQRMGGDIAVSSREGQTSFALRLPSDGVDR
ncbi:MAG TPA: HAMP domain-containing sensor histidine kinase [Gaiellales bacterium]|jgi:signal transduction histidine kinase